MDDIIVWLAMTSFGGELDESSVRSGEPPSIVVPPPP
jgi:hypothetical protein